MWNSGNQPHDLSKQVNEMSAALQMRPDCLQQFMTGTLNVETLAAMRPPQVPQQNIASHIPGSSQMWGNLQNTSMYQPTYESSFSNILSGASQTALLHQPAVTMPIGTLHSDLPFRSPPFTSDSTSLMELSTVTPSRIKNSPAAIISKGVSVTGMGGDDIAGTSKSSYPPAPAYEDTISSDYIPHPENISDDQFKIVIGNNRPSDNTSTDTFVVNLDSLDDPQSSIPEEPETADYPDESALSQSDKGNSDLDTAQGDIGNDDIVKRKRGRKKKDMLTKIPKDLRGLMGEANLAYARGAHEDAIKMCMEVVRLAPYAAEPYDTLSMIYEEKGEPVRALQYSLLSAHLSKTSATQWVGLAGMCLNQGDIDKAIDCYTRAAKARPTDYKLQVECGKLCMKQLNLQKAILFYKSAVMLMPAEEGKEAVELARELAKMCHNEKHNTYGIMLLDQAFESHPSHFRDEDANLLCELHLMEKQYTEVLKLLIKHCDLDVQLGEYEEPDYSGITKTPESMPVDLLCKLAVATIQLGRSDIVEEIIKSICSHNPADTGDIQFELAEAYIAVGKYPEALVILDPLVSSRDYSLAAVWLRHGECHRELSNIESAVTSYKNCVRLAPGHVHSHLLYSKMLRKAEKYAQSSQTLDVAENYEIEPEDHARICYERYKVHKIWADRSKKKRDAIATAADAALIIFANKHKASAFKEARVYLVRRKKRSSNPTAGELKLIQLRHLQLPEHDKLTESDLYFKSVVDIFNTREKWMEFFEETISLLFRCRRFKDAANLCEGIQCYSRFNEHSQSKKLVEHAAYCSFILAKRYQRAYSVLTVWLRGDLSSNALWNAFNQLILKTGDQRHQKFCLRLLVKNPRHISVIIVAAHNWMASGYYKTALGEYMYVHKQVPNEPLYVLMIGVAFINLCTQKFTDFKHSFITQALAYFQKYQELRQLDQEGFYNMGRAMHQVGLEHFAIHYYEKALQCKVPDVEGNFDEELFDLRKETAFNLSLIYRKSGNHTKANQLLEEFCTI